MVKIKGKENKRNQKKKIIWLKLENSKVERGKKTKTKKKIKEQAG